MLINLKREAILMHKKHVLHSTVPLSKVSWGILDRASSRPGEEANGPGAGLSWVHHILVELEEGRFQQP